MMNPIFQLHKVKPKIYLLSFDRHYDLAMHFFRYQEYYESLNPKFKGQSFTLLDYMDWYVTRFDDEKLSFTYASDWNGFNFPAKIIKEVRDKGIQDWNRYDSFMNSLYDMVSATDDDFYLIGSRADCQETIRHEIAHALYYTNAQYKLEMEAITNKLSKDVLHKLFEELNIMGYNPLLFRDEIQAYMSTGIAWDDTDGTYAKHTKPYVDCFNIYNNDANTITMDMSSLKQESNEPQKVGA